MSVFKCTPWTSAGDLIRGRNWQTGGPWLTGISSNQFVIIDSGMNSFLMIKCIQLIHILYTHRYTTFSLLRLNSDGNTTTDFLFFLNFLNFEIVIDYIIQSNQRPYCVQHLTTTFNIKKRYTIMKWFSKCQKLHKQKMYWYIMMVVI